MNSFAAFFKLIRWVNLVFIALTQILFYYLVLPFVYAGNSTHGPYLSQPDFFILIATSVCIAAAGYIINDYFDVHIDETNKPGKNIVGKEISAGTAKNLYYLLVLNAAILLK